MVRGLTRADLPALNPLRSRTNDDFAIAFLDAAAMAVDNIAFYSERISNEAYLRTATERRSLEGLARLVGYQVGPALAATLDLAFTVTSTPGTSPLVPIPVHTAAQSTPDPGMAPVVVETLAEVLGNPSWNVIRPRPRKSHPVTPPAAAAGGVVVMLAGNVSPLVPGDGLLYRSGSALQFGIVAEVRVLTLVPNLPDAPGSPARTEVRVDPVSTEVKGNLQDGPPGAVPAAVPAAWAWAGPSIDADDLASELASRALSLEQMIEALQGSAGTPGEAWIYPRRASLFGSTAPLGSDLLSVTIQEAIRKAPGADNVLHQHLAGTIAALPWESATVATVTGTGPREVFLHGEVDVEPGSTIVLRDRSIWGAYRVESVAQEGLAAQSVSGRATRVVVDRNTGLDQFSIRRTTAFTGRRRCPLAAVPAPETLPLDQMELDGLYLGLTSGRRIVVSGTTAEIGSSTVAHATALSEVHHDLVARTTMVRFADYLPVALRRSSVTVAGNVAPASVGQSRSEVLGSGNASIPFQRFALRQPPLTYLPEASPRGRTNTLQIWVDGIRWDEVPHMLNAGPDDRCFTVREHGATTVVEFGDGVTGARLPTGAGNVSAVYRSGGGADGRVRSGQVSMLLTRPAGVSGVRNPVPGVGGMDAEDVTSVRANAPLRNQTIDRVVSLPDYAAFARAFSGVAKAHAVGILGLERRGVLLTVAGANGDPIGSGTPSGDALRAALGTAGDPRVLVTLVPHHHRNFRLQALVRTAPERRRRDVLAAAEQSLRINFSFDRRDLGEPVAASELVATLQRVPGVVAVTITHLWALEPGSMTGPPAGSPPAALTATVPSADTAFTDAAHPPGGAEILVLDPAPITWEVLP
ncbi:putative baseplate assembly protein [Arthrobacter sp. B0490]|uniref:putative baseplate assembly protein n=1 Tax=Arthrobacter sp. B0490 TaxID=2058891 RepID=UPI0015E3E7BB|nr:putative baseplate assembly protein [Arthrobacter sp. B0490]